MRMRLIATALVSVALLLPTAVAADGPEPVRVSPWLAPYTVEVDAGTPLYVSWGMLTCNYGAARRVPMAYTQWYELERVDEPESVLALTPGDTPAFWQEPTRNEADLGCPNDRSGEWVIWWVIDLPNLEPGTYELAIHIYLGHTLGGPLGVSYRPGAAADATVTIQVNAP